MKSHWFDDTLRLNAALFLQTFEDYQVARSIPDEAAVIISNAAEVEAKGIEADFSWLIGDYFTLSGNLAYVRTKYKKYEGAPCPTPVSVGCIDGVQNLSGKTLDNAPELTYSLAGEYRREVAASGGLEWFGTLEVVYKDDHNLFVLLPAETRQGSYHLANARLGFEVPGRWRASFWGRNLFDEEYLSWGELDTTGLRLIPGMPRTYGLTLDWFF